MTERWSFVRRVPGGQRLDPHQHVDCYIFRRDHPFDNGCIHEASIPVSYFYSGFRLRRFDTTYNSTNDTVTDHYNAILPPIFWRPMNMTTERGE